MIEVIFLFFIYILGDGVVQKRTVGSIANYDPLNNNYGSLTQGYIPSGPQRQSQSLEWEEVLPEPRRGNF